METRTDSVWIGGVVGIIGTVVRRVSSCITADDVYAGASRCWPKKTVGTVEGSLRVSWIFDDEESD